MSTSDESRDEVTVIWARKAAKFYEDLEAKQQRLVDRAVAELRASPTRGTDVLPLKGALKGKFRKVIGNYRLIYSFVADQRLLFVELLGDRKDIYR